MNNAVRIAMWSGPRNLSTALMRAFENRPDCAVVDEPFALEPVVQSDSGKEIDRTLFENAGAHAIDDILFAAGFENEGVDAVEVQQLSEQEPRGAAADNTYLCMHV